jgi:hypothetical protein
MADERIDAVIWSDILKLQLDGVMMHITLFKYYNISGLTGYMYMHKHHAEEEFHNYLHVLSDYINKYQKIPEMSQITAPAVELDGTTMEEKMMKGMELYQTWEMDVCAKLKKYQAELSQGKEYVNELICDVHKELKYINLMQNELLDGKYEELNCYLTKKWGD